MGEKKRGVKGQYAFLNLLDKISFTQIFLLWIMITVSFGILYFLMSISPSNAIQYRGAVVNSNVAGLVNSIYYSFITVTTTGYGDISPNGLSKLFAIFEVVFGVIIQGIVVSKLVSFKQETILEEIYSINYEEAFTNYRRGLSLVRTDIVILLEKIENKTIKPRELKDLWIIFSGLDQNLTNIKNLIIPSKEENQYNKKLDASKLELILNSMKLSMNKVLELIHVLKANELDWKEELMMTSIYYDIQTCREIIEFEFKRSVERKVIDKLNALRFILDELENEMKAGHKPKHENEPHNTTAQEEFPKEITIHAQPQEKHPEHHDQKEHQPAESRHIPDLTFNKEETVHTEPVEKKDQHHHQIENNGILDPRIVPDFELDKKNP
jgi:hypothetical protein